MNKNIYKQHDLFKVKHSWIPGKPNTLSRKQAEGIKIIKTQCTYRALSRDVLDEENQSMGEELSVDAACRLFNCTNKELWDRSFDEHNELHQLHKSIFGDFFWWE